MALISIPAHLGYAALLGLVGAESAGVPVPGETALIAAALLAHHNGLNLAFVIAIAAVGAILGDNLGYLIGRTGGRKLLERPGRFARHRRAILERGEPFFQRHGPKAVFLGRWIAGLRVGASWMAGISRMPWHVFLFWNALGGIAWATSVALAVYLLGPAVEHVLGPAGLAALLVVPAVFVLRMLWRRIRTGAAASSWWFRSRRAGMESP